MLATNARRQRRTGSHHAGFAREATPRLLLPAQSRPAGRPHEADAAASARRPQ
jgi:hypothetical protein